MKKNAVFKATALLLSFLLVLQISPITAWADELTASSESAPGQTGSSDTGANSDLSSQESSIFSEKSEIGSSEGRSSESDSSSEAASESDSSSEAASESDSSYEVASESDSSDEESLGQDVSGSQSEILEPAEDNSPEPLEEMVGSALVTNGNENPINGPNLASQYGYELPVNCQTKSNRS